MEKHNSRQAVEIYQSEEYLAANPSWHLEDSPWKAKQIHKIISSNALNFHSVGEIGCGVGEVIRQLSDMIPDASFYGYEVSPQAFKFAQARESRNVEFFLEDLLEKEIHYDLILCIDVFEHVEDYIGFLRALGTKSEYQIFHIPLDVSVLSVLTNSMITARERVGHLHYFSLETALATLCDTGYEVLDFFFTPAFLDRPAKTLKSKLAKVPRFLLYKISPKLMVKLLGGCSLLVLTRNTVPHKL